jgi:hypothetical protein
MTNSSRPAHLESARYLSHSLMAERMLWQENNIAMGYSPKAGGLTGAIAIPSQGAGQVLV